VSKSIAESFIVTNGKKPLNEIWPYEQFLRKTKTKENKKTLKIINPI
jgi:hypothetical protein